MKNRRSFLKNITAGAALTALAAIPFRSMAKHEKISGVLLHHVYFWLKEPNNPEARKQFEKAINELLKVETIRKSHLGVPASTEQRGVVDHTYTYSYLTLFDSKEDQDIYQVHPIHIKFVEENQHLWEKVIVYDSVDL